MAAGSFRPARAGCQGRIVKAEQQPRSGARPGALALPDLTAMLAAQVKMLEAIASHRPLDAALAPLVDFIESLLPEVRCSVLLVDPVTRTLNNAAAPHLPPDYASSLRGIPVKNNFGTCGAAAFCGEMVVTASIERDPNWAPLPSYRNAALGHGLRACWSMPFRDAAGAVIGTFAMYRGVEGSPSSTEIETIRFATAVAGLVVDRHRDMLALRESEDRYRRLTELNPDGVIVHRRGRILYANRAFGRFLDGRGADSPVGRRLDDLFVAAEPGELAALQVGLLSLRLRGPAGLLLDVEISAAPITMFGEDATLLIVRDVSERRDLEQALAEAAEQERMRLSLDLHDGLGQQLTGASLLLASIAGKLAAAPVELRDEFARVQQVLRDSIEEARALASAMAPVEVERGGLPGALRELGHRIERAHGIVVDIDVDDSVARLVTREVAAQLFRIAQEAVSNAARHSSCRSICLELARTDGHVDLGIADDGDGFAMRDMAQRGLGLRGMRYRATRIGATFRVEPRAPSGTRVTVRWPLAAAAAR